MANRITAFISYSWDSPEHQEWVLKLATDLIRIYGVNVLLDQFELIAGRELTMFMESSVEKADKVLVIMTPKYQQKADKREGGVGYEYSMISQGLFATQTDNNKFIPILREGDIKISSPIYLKGRIYHDMRNSSEYESALYQLSRLLYEKPEKIKPELGPVPDFDNFNLDPLLAQMKHLSAQTAANNELDRKLSTNSIQLVEQEITKLFHMIEDKARLYNAQSEIDIRFTFERRYSESLIISSNRHSVVFNWQQVYSNSLTDSYLGVANWAGKPTFSGNFFYFPGEEPQRLTEKQWTFDLDVSGEPVWVNGSKRVKSEVLAHDAFAYIIDRIRNERSKNFRK